MCKTDEDLLFVKTQHNPADYGTRPETIEANFDNLKPEGMFRTGPKFLNKGQEKAIQDQDIYQMNLLTQQIQQQEMDQLVNIPPGDNIDIDPVSLDLTDEKANAVNTVLLINFSNQTFLEDIEKATEFSNYILHPLKLSY